MISHQIAKMIDHAVLHPTQTMMDLDMAIDLSLKYNIASLCVKPYMVPHTADRFSGFDVLTSTVIGFPHGSNNTKTKAIHMLTSKMLKSTRLVQNNFALSRSVSSNCEEHKQQTERTDCMQNTECLPKCKKQSSGSNNTKDAKAQCK